MSGYDDDDHAANDLDDRSPWTGQVRKMENGNTSIPFSVAFVLKKLE